MTTSVRHLSAWILAALLATWWSWLAAFDALGDYGWRWQTAMIWPAIPLVLVSAWATARVGRRHPRALGMALLASPMIVMPVREFVRAAQSYFDGSARLVRVGMPAGIPPYGLDETTRIPLYFSGCVTTDVWNARVWINNETVLWLTRTLGPMPGLYAGPLPMGDEIVLALARSGRSLREVDDGVALHLGDVRVTPSLALRLTLETFHRDVPVVLLHDRLLVIGEDLRAPDFFVFDVATGRHLGGGLAPDVAEAHPELAPRWQREAIEDRREARRRRRD